MEDGGKIQLKKKTTKKKHNYSDINTHRCLHVQTHTQKKKELKRQLYATTHKMIRKLLAPVSEQTSLSEAKKRKNQKKRWFGWRLVKSINIML
jgi:hypothetical protein